jgi:hypothetical protein
MTKSFDSRFYDSFIEVIRYLTEQGIIDKHELNMLNPELCYELKPLKGGLKNLVVPSQLLIDFLHKEINKETNDND